MAEMFITVIEDRHADIEVELFATEEDARDYAWKWATEQVEDNDEEIEQPGYHCDDWLLVLRYSCEGDCVRVERKTVDSETREARRWRAKVEVEKIAEMIRNLEAAGYTVAENEVTEPRRFEVTISQTGGTLTFAAATRRKAWENLARMIPAATEDRA